MLSFILRILYRKLPKTPLNRIHLPILRRNLRTSLNKVIIIALVTEFLCMKFVKKIKVNDCFLRWMNPEILHPVDVVKASTRNKERD